MPAVMVAGGLAVFAMVIGRVDYSRYLLYPTFRRGRAHHFLRRTRRRGLGFLCSTLPADVFMGDVGALALARRWHRRDHRRQEIVLFIMAACSSPRRFGDAPGALFQVERRQTHFPNGAASSPLRALWVEGVAVVVRFWIITMMLVLFGLSTLKLR